MPENNEQKSEYPYIGLPLPDRVDEPSSFFHKPDAVSDWLNNLPLANPLECAKTLYKNLFEMNRIKLASDKRISTLEKMLGPIESSSANLKSKYISTSFPLSEKSRKTALLNRELFRELCTAYKIAIADQITTGSAKSEQNEHITAVHRILHYLNKTLFHSYIIYEAYPVNVWRELHLLFTYSSLNKIDNIPVHDKDGDSIATTSRQIYLKSLLLAAASPYQLRQREIESLCLVLNQLSKYAKLSIRHIKDRDNDIGFLVDLHSDKPPVPIVYAAKQGSRQMFVLDTRLLLEKVQQTMTHDSAEHLPAMNDHLKQMILKNWGHASQRHYLRTSLNFDLNIAIGLNDIHELLDFETNENILHEHNVAANRSQDNLHRSSMFTSEEEDISILTLGDYNSQEENKGTYLSSQGIDKDLRIDAAELLVDHSNKISEKTHECKTINESAGGFCIEWPDKNAPGIRVGQIIAIQSTSKPGDFGLAITRWLKNLPENQLLVGIEVISKTCQAIIVRADKLVAKHKAATFYPGLFIPPSEDKPAFAITSSDLFKQDQRLITKDKADKQGRIKLTRLIESTGLFSLFETESLPFDEPDKDVGQREEPPELLG